MKKLLTLVFALILVKSAISQTLFVPGGTIGNSTTGNVGIGTYTPASKLHVYDNSQGNTTFIIESGSNNVDYLSSRILLRSPNTYRGNGIHTSTGGTINWFFGNPYNSNDNFIISRLAGTENNAVAQISNALFMVSSNGNVGIGTTNPESKLVIKGGGSGSFMFDPDNINIHSNHNGYELSISGGSTHNNGGKIRLGGGNRGDNCINAIQFIQGTTEVMRINNGGNVGIGITNPQYKLTIEGTIAAREIKVTTEVWSDFVFYPTYKLRSLGEVEQFIKTNSHLPEIPSAAEVKENGVSLGEMNAKLLLKIEELTLYMIEQNKKIENQNEKVQTLENAIKELKKLNKNP